MNIKLVVTTCLGIVLGANLVFADIQIKGSDTMVNLVQKLAEVYMQKNPGASISITGGGSGTGFAALINRKTDIANSSRKIKDKELQKCKDKGIDPREVVIGIDGLSVIVNAQNAILKLSMEQIGAIYRGDVTNWSAVGGNDAPIVLYGRQPNSGTFDFFREHVLDAEYSQKMNQMNGNSQIVEAVRHDVNGIGYVGVGYVVKDGKAVSGIVILNVEKNGIGYSPIDRNNIVMGRYPIARGLQQYVDGVPKGLTKSFIEFELSPEGQKIIEAEGFYSLSGGSAFAEPNKKLFVKKSKVF